jgi:CO/xanthine dehydrogenase FAD-binding subunit
MKGEANRCFNCGCVAVSPSDLAPALIALRARIKTTSRTVSAEEFFTVGPKRSTILRPGELVTEIQIPAPRPGSKQVYLKFRTRKAIDFPIVGVAAVINVQAEKVTDARVVLGAVAPVPLRAREAEDFLRGKVLGEDVADKAAALALKGALPLGRNGYKAQIAKALVKRAILAGAGR